MVNDDPTRLRMQPCSYPPTRLGQMGFALVSALVLMSVIVIVALGMLALSSVATRSFAIDNHAAIAQSNARLALMLAISELQLHAGADQRTTAPAAILESPGDPVANRNWVGVWKTTHTSNAREWPVIGKGPSDGSDGSPYSQAGVYEDLRHTQGALNNDQWIDALRLDWMVSKRTPSIDPRVQLNPNDPTVVELMGRGTLGDTMQASEFVQNQILAQKVDVGSNGAYAWHVSDESLKATISPVADPRPDALFHEAAAQANPELVRVGGVQPFVGLRTAMEPHVGKFTSFGNASLVMSQPTDQQLLRSQRNHFTVEAGGLFTNPVTGGLKRDLTPLLLGRNGESSINFDVTIGGSNRRFSSRLPIIPGQEHGVLGPSFDALRDWAQHAYTNLQDAETGFPSTAVRIRPTTNWAHAISDGAAADGANWAAQAPKIHPVMTDVRWHYYFSIHNNRIRTHIIPRVCLWNPYNRALNVPDLTVLMPNPFFNISHGMHFFPEESHADELIATGVFPFSEWCTSGGYVGGDVYKMRVNPFPTERFLSFTLEGGLLGSGECHVYSPKISTPQISTAGVNLQQFDTTNPSRNILSSSSVQGMDHYFFDHPPSATYQIQDETSPSPNRQTTWRNLSSTQVDQINFRLIFDYQPEVSVSDQASATIFRVENFPFVLKSGVSNNLSTLLSSSAFPTLQLVYFGGGGARPVSTFQYDGTAWGSANQQSNSFGYLERFEDAPLKDAADTHQVGAKLLWFDERSTEGNAPPLRNNRWSIDHMALNVAPIANWNVRSQLAMRSPSSQASRRWFMLSAGNWFLQYVPYSPQSVNDQPTVNAEGRFIKNPFGANVDFSFNPNVVLFDLPSDGHGVLSLARLRHANLSPFSWSPTYIIGHSLRDLNAPSDRSKHQIAALTTTPSGFPNRWDFLLGAANGVSTHGALARAADSQGLLQIGNQAVTKNTAGQTFSSANEILAYDIAYEVNANLWDDYFLSSVPVSSGTNGFAWDLQTPLLNPRYRFNPSGTLTRANALDLLSGANGLGNGFYRNAEMLENAGAFNVNSASVQAWVAFLSSALSKSRPLSNGDFSGEDVTFSRTLRPVGVATTDQADPNAPGAWIGGRRLTSDEVLALAESIVNEVKSRGPFLSVSDFINRRLADRNNPHSHQGTLDAAIMTSGLNANFETDPIFRTTAVNRVGTDDNTVWDNNLSDFQNGYRYLDSNGQPTTTQPRSKAWGLPGFLTQSDILEPLAPALTTRGDTFVVRAYGESRDASGIKARAWVEAVVARTPNYVEHRDSDDPGTAGNTPFDAALEVNHESGRLLEGNLNVVNRRFGRQFVIKSFRWLHPDEV